MTIIGEFMDNNIYINNENDTILECEKLWVFIFLMFVSGFYGAYTYTLKGGVFCNAQTANFVMMAIAIGNFNITKAVYYLIPMAAYIIGAMISEELALRIKKYNFIRWDTLLILIEIFVVILLGFLPDSLPFQVSQVIVNFICSMQYNTFRQANKIPLATTFCTNHTRQVGVKLVKFFRHKDKKQISNMFVHIKMLCAFVLGASIATYLGLKMGNKSLFFNLIPLSIVFIELFKADRFKERGKLHLKPSGH